MSQPYRPSVFVKAYYRFKAIKLPWRRKFFRGFDLDGNSFYESYNPLTPHKMRRTVKYIKDGHYTDNNVTPQWMQWLRHTRTEAPTESELLQEVHRIQATRQNAFLISQKWDEEKTRLGLLSPDSSAKTTGQLEAKLTDLESDGETAKQMETRQTDRASVLSEARVQEEAIQSERPKQVNEDYLSAPGTKDEKGEWQPEAWNPATAKKPIRR